jgi:ubiquinone/menaquinone biosynthesis C-methylase UbiE
MRDSSEALRHLPAWGFTPSAVARVIEVEKNMSKLADQQYLLTEQYQDASHLNARAALHARFSTNLVGWHGWVFDQFDVPDRSRILELGCGPAWLWQHNLQNLRSGWEITLSDFSPGMLAEARQNLGAHQKYFRFERIDAQAIRFGDARFDVVIANHMLYHVPDRPKAYAEIRRVLRPQGLVYAATNGSAHLRELFELAQRFDPALLPWGERPTDHFSLENGADELKQWFSSVKLHRYPDALIVTEAEPLVAFVLSMQSTPLSVERRAEFVQFVEQELARHGAIRITKDSGLFEATRPAADR